MIYSRDTNSRKDFEKETLGKRTIGRLINSLDYFHKIMDNPRKYRNLMYTSSFMILGLTGYEVFKGDYNTSHSLIRLGIPALMSFVGYKRYENYKNMKERENRKREEYLVNKRYEDHKKRVEEMNRIKGMIG